MTEDIAEQFVDIGYKYPAVPHGLTVSGCLDFVENAKLRFLSESIEYINEQSGKRLANTFARIQIFGFLNKLPEHEWTEEHHKLLAYGLSDLDFYSSERQFQEICDQCLRCR